MPVPSLPTELLEDIVNIVNDDLTILGDVYEFAKNIIFVNRRWTPIGRRLLRKELALAMDGNGMINFKKHLDVHPHLVELVEFVTLFKEDPNVAAQAVNWEASKMDSLLQVVRRCQNLVGLRCHFIPDNGGHGYGDPRENIEKPFYDLFEATSRLPKLERFELFWPNLSLKRFASILVSGFPALLDLKLSFDEFSGHELQQYTDYDPTTEIAAGIVQSPVLVLTVRLGGEPTAMCRILGRAIDPTILAELYLHGNGISNYDELPQWIASFPALERLSLRLRGGKQQEVLPALSTALTGLQHLSHVLLRRNWDKWDDSQSRGEYYWSPVPLDDLLSRLPPRIERFILEGLVFPSAPLEGFAQLGNWDELPPSDSWFFGQMVGADGIQQSFQLLTYETVDDETEEKELEWHWVLDVRPFGSRRFVSLHRWTLTPFNFTESNSSAQAEHVYTWLRVSGGRRYLQVLRRGHELKFSTWFLHFLPFLLPRPLLQPFLVFSSVTHSSLSTSDLLHLGFLSSPLPSLPSSSNKRTTTSLSYALLDVFLRRHHTPLILAAPFLDIPTLLLDFLRKVESSSRSTSDVSSLGLHVGMISKHRVRCLMKYNLLPVIRALAATLDIFDAASTWSERRAHGLERSRCLSECVSCVMNEFMCRNGERRSSKECSFTSLPLPTSSVHLDDSNSIRSRREHSISNLQAGRITLDAISSNLLYYNTDLDSVTMPIHSLPTELIQEIVDIVDSDYPMLGDSWQFGRTITQVSRLWQPMGRRIIWKERVLGLAEDDSVQLDRHLDSFPHLADIVQVLYAYKSDPTDSARALPWSDSQMGALHSILRRCQNLYSVKLRFIADNGNYGPVKVDIVQPFYDLFESASKLPKLERFEIFWPEITMKSFDDILVSGFPALRELKLSIGQFSGLDFLGDGLEESTSTRTRTVVRSPLEILTVTLGGDPGGICRTLRQAIDPSTLAELYVSGNGIANYDKLVRFISSFPSLERLSLSLRGAQQREILPALSTAITPLENLTHVLIRRNWDKFDRSESQGEFYWSPIDLRELLDCFPFSMSTFILEGLVFAPDQIDPVVFIEESSQLPPSYCSFFGQVVGEEEDCHDFHMILSAPTDGDDEEEYESEWRFVINSPLLKPTMKESYGYKYSAPVEITKFFEEA